MEIHTFEVGNKLCENLILNLPSETKTEKSDLSPILIAADYNPVPGTPEADENPSGVVVLIEFAIICSTELIKYPIQLVAFDRSQAGLLNSADYANKLRREMQKLSLMMSLEIIGYCNANPSCQVYPSHLERFYPNTSDFIA